jgi:hypothetical protein
VPLEAAKGTTTRQPATEGADMAKPNAARLRVLRAAERGELFHSIYQGYDWIDLLAADGGKVTATVQAALRDELIVLLPRQRGDEHRGQKYALTDAGRRVLAGHDNQPKEQ